MAHCKHLLRPLFHLNAIAGLSTVCPESWEKSNGKRAYACFWLVVYIVEIILCVRLYLNTDEITDFHMFGWSSNYLLMVFLLLQSICDHKTVLTAVLSLEAIRDRTEAEGVPTAPLNIGYFVTVLMAVTNLIVIVISTVNTFTIDKNVKIFTSYLTTLHYMTLQWVHALSYLTFMFVVLQAEESVNEALRRGFESESREEFARTRDFRRTKLLKFIREMKGALSHVEDSLHEYFKMFLTYRFFFACIILPRVIHLAVIDPVKNAVLAASFATVSLFTVFVLYVNGKIAASGSVLQTVLYEYCLSLRSQVEKKEFRQMTLACLHRRQTPTCWIFGLEFGLVMTLLDTALLVFLSSSSFAEADD